MIILTPRLKAMADNIDSNESFADIGTDHGYLPLYFLEKDKNQDRKIIMSDVNEGPLKKARDNYSRLFPYEFGNNRIQLRLGDGIDVLEKGEVDVVVIAGMGGLLMKEILDWDISKTLSFPKYILQPRNNGGALRRYLYEIGFSIEKLFVMPEEKRFSEIMICYAPRMYSDRKDSSEIEDLSFDFPDLLLEKPNTFTKEYLENQIEIETRIINNIINGKNKSDDFSGEGAITYRNNRISRINELLNELK